MNRGETEGIAESCCRRAVTELLLLRCQKLLRDWLELGIRAMWQEGLCRGPRNKGKNQRGQYKPGPEARGLMLESGTGLTGEEAR